MLTREERIARRIGAIVLTRAQREALFRVFQRDFPSWLTPAKRKSHYGDTVVKVRPFSGGASVR